MLRTRQGEERTAFQRPYIYSTVLTYASTGGR